MLIVKLVLIKVVGIFVQFAVLRLHVLYKIELRADNSNIAAQNSLLIALSSQLRFELMLVTDKG